MWLFLYVFTPSRQWVYASSIESVTVIIYRYMNDSKPSNDQAIASFLELFDDNPVQAVQSIRTYVQSQGLTKRQSVTTSTEPVVISLDDVTKLYKVGKQKIAALAGVSLEIRQGEFVALTGASGSGKSTLLQLIGGLDKPTTGTVVVDGSDLKKMRDNALSTFRNQTIGFVFQFFYLQPFLRVGTNLEVPAMFARAKRSVRRQSARKLAESVGIADRLAHLPSELSGGQMQRVAVARALLNQPKVLLADEPTGNLDSTNSRAIIELFEEVRKQFGTTIIIVTHDAAIAAQADREIRLRDGVIV